jgi:hypothetical protein
MKQTPPTHTSFARGEYDRKKKPTQRALFLEKVEQVVRGSGW